MDNYVEERVLEALRGQGGFIAEARQANENLAEAERAVTEAEHELDLFLSNPKLLTMLGQERALEGVELRQQAVDDARRWVAELRSRTTLITGLAEGDVLQAWPTLAVVERRRLLHGLLDSVVLARAGSRGRQAPPIGERTTIFARGNQILD